MTDDWLPDRGGLARSATPKALDNQVAASVELEKLLIGIWDSSLYTERTYDGEEYFAEKDATLADALAAINKLYIPRSKVEQIFKDLAKVLGEL